jgi:MFS transporter, DHA3 family, macrolide efflux protein
MVKEWRSFRILLFGQAVSLLGTGMTRFAVMIWAYERTGTATSLAMLGFFACITYVLVSPLAGVLIDRLDRRKVMFLSDLGAGLMTAMLLALNLAGRLEIWHLYLAEGMSGMFEAFQEPAFSAAVSLLVPKDGYTRANALLGLGRSAARMFAPAAAGLLLPAFGRPEIGLSAVMAVDLATLSLALFGLLLVRIPPAPVSSTGQQAGGSWRKQLRFGSTYIWQRPGLRELLGTFFLINLFATLTYFAVLSPMILARSRGNEAALGLVRTVMGLGGILGGIIISLWGGTHRKARLFLVSTALSFLVCDFLTAISRSTIGWSVAGFLSELTIPFIVAPYFALWQEHVPADVQGRVFATREAVQVLAQPAGYLLGGWLADVWFEPALASGGPLAGSLGLLVGNGPGAGMSAMFLFTSLLGGLTGLLGLLSPHMAALDRAQLHSERTDALERESSSRPTPGFGD